MSPLNNERTSPEMRVGDRERNQATDELREHYVLGRLDQPEFEQRLEAAFAARTAHELRTLLADLPSGSRGVDWRPGAPTTGDGSDTAGQVDRNRPRYGWPPHGHPYRGPRGRRHGPGRVHPHHHGPGFLPLLPIVGMMVFFGGWALMFLLPLLVGGVLFSAARMARLR